MQTTHKKVEKYAAAHDILQSQVVGKLKQPTQSASCESYENERSANTASTTRARRKHDLRPRLGGH